MKNLGITTKKIVRKITAIAGATLMAGMSLGIAAADLSALSDTFISAGELNAYVVLGTGGATNVLGFAKDVAGAIVVGGALAQQATTTASSSGSAVLERNITTGYLNSSTMGQAFALNGAESVGMQWNNAAAGFSWLPNQTVSNATGIIANMTGILSITDRANNGELLSGNGLKTVSEGNIRLYDGSIIYNLTFQDFVSGYNGLGKNSTGIILPGGDSYKLTGWTTDGTTERVTLGDFNELEAVPGTVYDIGSTGATFEILGYTQSSDGSYKLKVKVLDSDGTVLANEGFAPDSEVYGSDDYTLRVISFEINSADSTIETASLEWSTGVLTLEEGNTSVGITGGENWTVRVGTSTAGGITIDANSNDTRNITWIAWVFEAPDSFVTVSPDTEIGLFGDYFKLTVDGLEINSTDASESTISIFNLDADESEIAYTDENGSAHYIDISPISTGVVSTNDFDVEFAWLVGNSSTADDYTLTCVCASTGAYNLSFGSDVMADLISDNVFELNRTSSVNMPFSELWANISMGGTTSSDCTGMRFNVTLLNATSDAGTPIYNNITWVGSATSVMPGWNDYTDGTLNITETTQANRVEVIFDNGSLSGSSASVDYLVAGTRDPGKIPSTDDEYYTAYGTRLVRTDSDEITIYYPEGTRVMKVAIGQAGVKEYALSTDEYDEDLDVTLRSAGGSSVSLNKIDVGLAKLDTEVSSSSLDKPVVLMGGWAVNSLVQELVDAGSVATTDLAADRALVQLVSDALNSQDALIIAGWEGDDTRLAAQVVASQILGTDMGLSGAKAILNTGVTSYSDVTVV
jgi:hypothetical protein